MPLPAATTSDSSRAGWAAIASGAFGVLAFSAMLAYLMTTPKEILESEVVLKPGVMPPLSRLLLTSSEVLCMLQALIMIPVALVLHAFGRQRSQGVSRATVTIGVIALFSVALLRLLALFSPGVSGILFMGPTGFVGVWLIVVCWLLAGVLSRGLRIVGTIAGIGFVIQGASFFFLGGLAVLTDAPEAYANDVDFHNGNALGGVPAAILYPIWAMLLGRKLFRTPGS